MRYFKIVGRADINGVCDDIGLKALDGYFESDYEPFDDEMTHEDVAKYLCNKYEDQLTRIRSNKAVLEEKIN